MVYQSKVDPSTHIGQRFNRLVVLSYEGKNSHRSHVVKCVCDCGTVKDFVLSQLRSGVSGSCGCYQRDLTSARKSIHGMSKTQVYRAWWSMMRRCSVPECKGFEHYGGRGIKVCDRWLDFENFYTDMGHPPKGGTLERVDVNGNYCPENCTWASRTEQANNKTSNRMMKLGCATLNATQWDKEFGYREGTTHQRLSRGWTPEQIAKFRPTRSRKPLERI